MQVVFKNKTRLSNNSHFKDQISKDPTSGVVSKFQCGLNIESYYSKCVRHLNVRIGKHIAVSLLTKKQVKPKIRLEVDHLLFYNHSASYDKFNILMFENKKVLLELKEGLSVNNERSTITVCDKGSVQLTFSLVMRFNTTVEIYHHCHKL